MQYGGSRPLHHGTAAEAPHRSRFLDILDSLKNEHEQVLSELSIYKNQKEDYEHKMSSQISELGLIQKNLFELERSHIRLKQQYEEELSRLRKGDSSTILSASVPNLGSGILSNSALASTVITDFSKLKRPREDAKESSSHASIDSHLVPEDSSPAKLTSLPVSTRTTEAEKESKDNMPPKQSSSASLNTQQIPTNTDWRLVYNPNIPNKLKLDLMQSFDHQSVVCCVAFSPDASLLATGSNHLVRLFKVDNGEIIATFDDSKGKGDAQLKDSYVRTLVFSNDGKLIISGGEDGIIRVWDINRKELKQQLQGHRSDIYSLSISKDGNLLVSGSGDKTIRIWKMKNDGFPELYKVLFVSDEDEDRESGITSVAISPDSSYIACGCLDKCLRLWDVKTGELLNTLEGHKDSIYTVAFSFDSKVLISGGLDKLIKVWDVEGGPKNAYCKQNIAGHKDFVLSASFIDDEMLISGSKDRSVQFWDYKTGQPLVMLYGGHSNSVISVSASRTSNCFATGSGDCRARIWKYKYIQESK